MQYLALFAIVLVCLGHAGALSYGEGTCRHRDTTAHQTAVDLQTAYKSSLYMPMMAGSSERALIEAVEDVYGRFGTPFLSPDAYDWKRVREALRKCPPVAIPQLHAAFLSRASHINLTREYIESELRTSEPWLAEWADHDPAPLYGTGCASRVSTLDMLLTLGSLEQLDVALFEYGDAVEEYVRIAVGFVDRHPLRVLDTSNIAPTEKASKELSLVVYAIIRGIVGMELSSSPHNGSGDSAYAGDDSDEHDYYSNIKVRLQFGDCECNDDGDSSTEDYVREGAGFVDSFSFGALDPPSMLPYAARFPVGTMDPPSMLPYAVRAKPWPMETYVLASDIDSVLVDSAPHGDSAHDGGGSMDGTAVVLDGAGIPEYDGIAVFDCEDDELGDGSNAGGIDEDDDLANYDDDDDRDDGEMDDDDYVSQRYDGSYSNIYNAYWP